MDPHGLRFERPLRTRVQLLPAGRALLPVAAAGFVTSWIAGGTAGLFTALVFTLAAIAIPRTLLPLHGLELSLPGRFEVAVGDPFQVELRCRNRSLLSAVDIAFTTGTGSGDDPRPMGAVGRVGGSAEVRVPLALRLFERGRVRTLRIAVFTSFPLGIVRATLFFDLPVDLRGLPRRGRLATPLQRPSSTPWTRPRDLRMQRGEDEFYGVREWREGESLRRVHWRISARRDTLVVREFVAETEGPVHLWLVSGTRERGPWSERDPAFEKAVSLTATVGEHLLARGHEVFFDVARYPQHHRGGLRGHAGLKRLLILLSEVRCERGAPWLDVERVLARRDPRPVWNVVCLVGGGGKPPGAATGALVLDVDDPAVDELFQRGRTPTRRLKRPREAVR